MQALVLERKGELNIRDIGGPAELGADDVRIKIHTVGICGSDVHYYVHGGAGPCIVREPMTLGHEASGVVTEVGPAVKNLKVNDRVCMEPGIPNPKSKAAKLGLYNVDPEVRFWATPPVHGCLTESVVHPAAFTYKIPEQVSFGEAAMIEPLAIGIQAAVKAKIKPGDVAVVLGSGTIGLMTAMAAFGGGCSRVYITDMHQPKLDIAGKYPGIIPVNIDKEDVVKKIKKETDGWGADIVFEASGSPKAIASLVELACPGGRIVLIGVPVEAYHFDIAAAINKEVQINTIFRYANVYERAVNLVAAGKIDLKPLISAVFPFADSIKAFERAASHLPDDVKIQIQLFD